MTNFGFWVTIHNIRRLRKGNCDMPEKGFSFEDLLYPKPRKYVDNYPKTPLRIKSRKAKAEAERILKELNLNSLPIPLEPICEYLGACVVYLNRISDNSKAAGRFLGNGMIEIIKGLPQNLFRSTLAHELGHLALNHDTRSKWDEIDSFQDPDPHEKEAWDFAGEILVPDKILKPLFVDNPKPEILAQKFMVSSDFMWVQLIKRRYI